MAQEQKQRPLRVGVLLNSLFNNFTLEIVAGMRAQAEADGHQLFFFPGNSLSDSNHLDRQFNIVFLLANSSRLDAIVSLTSVVAIHLARTQVAQFLNVFRPIPLVNLFYDYPGCPSIQIDNRTGMRELMHHLIHHHGYKRFAFLKGPTGNPNAESRFQLFCEFLTEAGIPVDPELVEQANFDYLEAGDAVVRLLARQRPFDVLVAANDGMAFGAMDMAFKRGVSVPRDFAIVGFDDLPKVTPGDAALTSVNMPMRQAGATSIKLAQAHCTGDDVAHTTYLSTRLVRRLTCGCRAKFQKETDASPSAAESFRASLSIPTEAVVEYQHYLEQIDKALCAGEDVYEACLNDLAFICLSDHSDVTRLQALLLFMYNRPKTVVSEGESDAPRLTIERLLDGQLILSNARDIYKALRPDSLAFSDHSFKEIKYLKRKMVGLEVSDIGKVLETALREFNIPTALIVLYEKSCRFSDWHQPQLVPATSQVVFAMSNGVARSHGLNRSFATHQLIPEDLCPQESNKAFAILPIFEHSEHYGYMILDVQSKPSVRLESIRDEISGTLIHSILVKQLEQARDELKAHLHVATGHNAQLFEEVVGLNQRLQAVLDAANEESIIATDPEGRIQVFNRGAERMLGYSVQEVLGKSPIMFHLPEEVAHRGGQLSAQLNLPVQGFDVFVAGARLGKSETENWTYVCKDGRHLTVALSMNAIRNEKGDFDGFMGIARDITDQVAAQAKLQSLNSELDLRVQERTRELQASNVNLAQTLEHLQQTKRHFVEQEKLAALGSVVAAVSHELNTPLGICLTVASSLQEHTDGLQHAVKANALGRQQLMGYLDTVNESSRLMLRSLERSVKLIRNFKQVSVNQSNDNRRDFDLRDTVDGIVSLMRLKLNNTPYVLELDVAPGIAMNGFPGPIEQIVTNLINNAVLHGFEGRNHGVMRISGQRTDEDVVINFSDDGLGMEEDILKRVFDPFFTTKLGVGGSGLGLNICYNLVVGPLGGRIQASSVPGQGSLFTIILPRIAPAITAGPN